MTIQGWLVDNTQHLAQKGVATARLDCLVLLSHILNTNSAHLLAHSEMILTENELLQLKDAINRRSSHEPIAYIICSIEFYGRKFYVNSDVLIPRSESETIIDMLRTLKMPFSRILDIGTGSGALAITAKLEFPDRHTMASDINPACLKVAKRNARELGANIDFVVGDLLNPFGGASSSPTVYLCNLPYVPDNFTINAAAAHEPGLALFGGRDGLDVYRTLFKKLQHTTEVVGVITESLIFQHEDLAKIARHHGFVLMSADGLIQLFAQANY